MKAKCREYGLALPDYEHPSPSLPSPFLPSPMEPTSSLPSTSDNDQGLLSVDYRPRSSSSSFPEGSAPQNKTRRRSAPTAPHPHPYAPRQLRAIAPSNPGGVGIDSVGHARTHSTPALHITTAPPNNDNAYDAGAAAGNLTTVFSSASALSSPSSPNVYVSGPTDTSFAFGTPSSNHFNFELPSPSSSSTYSPNTNSPSSFDTPSTPASYHYGPTTTTSVFDLPSSPLKPTMPSPFKSNADLNSSLLPSLNGASSFEQDAFGFVTSTEPNANALWFQRDGDAMVM
ncbi:hypothetical protein EXIGLDRAFT_87191 [Exidia glandulosa HHB12029]|uniref:Uncharacterized protein n=1 Tax=Exidia glandulosa HHB12029 TaxID=1314781 RepID=A0A165HD67_EXIGL|nr:hypothetical protein EXIGLDRAFT_87191 [Exidia glandulosa HHB12029]